MNTTIIFIFTDLSILRAEKKPCRIFEEHFSRLLFQVVAMCVCALLCEHEECFEVEIAVGLIISLYEYYHIWKIKIVQCFWHWEYFFIFTLKISYKFIILICEGMATTVNEPASLWIKHMKRKSVQTSDRKRTAVITKIS